MTPNMISATDLIGGWLADLESGKQPVRYALPSPFGSIDLRPGMLAMFAGQPGAGKTAAILQLTVELLRMNPEARLLMANVEMTPVRLLERIVSRLSGVPLTLLRNRTIDNECMERVRAGTAAFCRVADRMTFLREPFTLQHLAVAADSAKANVFVVDYLQRFTLDGDPLEERAELNAMMSKLRKFCDDGALVLAVSALARGNSSAGSTYTNAGMASLRGSSELEYGGDAVYILQPADGNAVTFVNHKQRDADQEDIATSFNGAVQSFTAFDAMTAFDSVAPVPDNKRRGTP